MAGNSSRTDVTYTLEIPLEEMKLDNSTPYLVIDLWEDQSKVLQKEDPYRYCITVPADYSEGGGIRVVKIEPNERGMNWFYKHRF